MASDYRVGLGPNVPLASLVKLKPQPRSTGTQYASEDYSGNGIVIRQGLYIELIYDLLPNKTVYQAVLTDFGLESDTQSTITLYARDEIFDSVRFVGVAIRPMVSWERFYPRDITILVRQLEVLP